MSDGVPPRNLLDVAEEHRLWRVFKPEHLESLFRDKTLQLVAPWMWDDPFEDFLSRCYFITQDGLRVRIAITEGYYGLCWTDLEKESDATWRIYAPHPSRGVRVRVRAGTLFDCIYQADDWSSAHSCFLGRVTYLEEQEIREWLRELTVSTVLLDGTGEAQARTLLTKREAFRHESEVRLLYQQASPYSERHKLHGFACDPQGLVEQMLLDPRWTEEESEEFEDTIRSLGYVGPIERSSLYQIPEFEHLTL